MPPIPAAATVAIAAARLTTSIVPEATGSGSSGPVVGFQYVSGDVKRRVTAVLAGSVSARLKPGYVVEIGSPKPGVARFSSTLKKS